MISEFAFLNESFKSYIRSINFKLYNIVPCYNTDLFRKRCTTPGGFFVFSSKILSRLREPPNQILNSGAEAILWLKCFLGKDKKRSPTKSNKILIVSTMPEQQELELPKNNGSALFSRIKKNLYQSSKWLRTLVTCSSVPVPVPE